MLETFTRETFAPHLGETFRLGLDGGSDLELTLIETTDLSQPGASQAPGAPRAPFSVVFRGPREALLPQRIYRLRHDRLGAFEVFLVPIGPDAVGMRFEAVFS
ncbi:MAG TPA: hypothetical protein VHQ00_06980 [Chloroflexota bacterium]|nr:hypothetical protein [Chloroflexota bacterium]